LVDGEAGDDLCMGWELCCFGKLTYKGVCHFGEGLGHWAFPEVIVIAVWQCVVVSHDDVRVMLRLFTGMVVCVDFTQKTQFCNKPVYPTPFTPKFPLCPTGLDFCLFTRLPNITRDLGW
jgi:hypothetical protein